MKNVPNFFRLRGSGVTKLTAFLLAFLFILTPAMQVFADDLATPVDASTPEITNNLPSNDNLAPTSDAIPQVDPVPPDNNPVDSSKDVAKEPTPEPQSSLSNTATSFKDGLGQGMLGNAKKLLPGVDPSSGALTYSYHIETPPGRNGIQPNLNLNYSSQETDQSSIFGLGWSLDIPYITRVNKNGSDKLYSSTNFSSTMSGDLVSGDGTNYAARVENGDLLKYAISSDVWTVTDKNGTTYKYGTNATERQDDPGNSGNIYKWMLQEVRDTNDNYIRYEYYKDGGQIYPADIKYTGNGSTDGIFEIDFLRESRTDLIQSARPGFSVTSNYRINEIQAKVSGTWMRKYALSYTTGDQSAQSALDTITETGKDDSANTVSLPSFNFDYQASLPSGNGFVYDSSWTLPVDPKDGVQIIDVNGDGLNDLVQSVIGSPNYQRTYLNTGTGWSLSSNFVPPTDVYFMDAYKRDLGVRMADVNGDGLPDIVVNDAWTHQTYINNGSGWTLDASWAPPQSMSFIETHYYDTSSRLVDINGDGLPDFIRAYESGGTIYTTDWINTGSGWAADNTWSSSVNFTRGVVFGDVNGDGLTDILQSYNDGSGGASLHGVYINNGHGWTQNTSYTLPVLFLVDNTQIPDTGARVADINGDGLADIIAKGSENGAFLNNGAGWSSDITAWHSPLPFTYTNNANDNGTRIADVNGDGLPDIFSNGDVRINQAKKANLMVTITYPQGGNTAVTYKASPLYTNGSTLLNPNLPLALDTVNQTVTSDGAGGPNTTNNYSYQNGLYYFNSSSPLDHKFSGFGIVNTTDSGGNITKAYAHQGNSSDSSHGEYADEFAKIGRVYRTEAYDNSGNLNSKTINKWDSYDLGNGQKFVKLAQTVNSTYDGDSTHRDTAESYTYDNTNGNLTQKVQSGEVTGNDDGTFTDTGTDDFTTAISYASNTTANILGLPSQATVTDHSATKVKESKYYYDTQTLGNVTKGNLTKQEDWKTGSTYINSQKTYDGTYGLVTMDTDPRGNTTQYSYDTNNLYPATVTNALTQVIQYTYDYSSGQVIQKTDPNTRVFQNVYDGLDRLLTVKQPDLTTPSTMVTKTSYAYTDTFGAFSVHKTDNLDGSTAKETYSYFDGLGRQIQQRIEAEGSNYAVSDKVYNNLGLLDKESLPYFSTGTSKTPATTTTSLYTTYAYDPIQRITTTTNAAGTTTNAYSDWKLTITDANSKPKDLYKDAYGNLVQVDEHNSGSTYSTYYTYNYLGNLLSLTDALANLRNFSYDGLGRRLTAQDLHASSDNSFGSYSYTYDDAGNLTQKVNPNSTINYTYDNINRQLTEDYTGHAGTEVTYTYDSGTDGIGQLTGITTADLSQTNTYNPVGGLKSEAKTLNGTVYTTAYDYDWQGNQILITNPDNSQIKYIYNSAGLLDQVQRKEMVNRSYYVDVITNFDYSPTAQVTVASYGNGMTTTNTFDASKLYRLSSKLTTIAGAVHAQDLAYTYDSNGNITQIIDSSATSSKKTAVYTYDDLNRLLSATITGVAKGQAPYTQTYTYSAIGNILTKSDSAGTYSYSGNSGKNYANPHAVTSIGSNNYIYDRNGNMLSGPALTNTWDYNNRLTQTIAGGLTNTYTYDPSGERLSLVGTTTTYYPSKMYNTDGTTVTKHIFANGVEVATITGTGKIAVAHSTATDHLTGSSVITDSLGAQEELLDYFPYGSIRIDEKTGSYGNQRQYAGSEFDSGTGLNYMQARYYNSSIGRFVSEDAVFLSLGQINSEDDKDNLRTILADPQVLNSYSYARNNPLIYNDPSGQFPNLLNAVKSAYNAIKSSVKSYIANQNTKTSSPEYQQKSMEAAKSGSVYIGQVNGKDTYVGFGVGSIESFGGNVGRVANGLTAGQQFGKLGSVIDNNAGKITGIFTRANGDEHALSRILNRSASIEDIARTVSSPLATLKQAGDNTLYLSREAVVVLNKLGQIVTTYGAKGFGSDIKNILGKIK